MQAVKIIFKHKSSNIIAVKNKIYNFTPIAKDTNANSQLKKNLQN